MDLFGTALRDESELRALYDVPSPVVSRKEIDHLDEHCKRYLSLCRFALVASADASGRCDVTPRGGPPGFISVADDHTLVILRTGRAGVLLLLPGRGQTLRINGRACISAAPDLLASLTAVGKAPRAALVLAVEEVFTHCPRAFVRSALWEPDTWPSKEEMPSPAAMLRDHVGAPDFTLEQAEQRVIDSVTVNLA